MGSSGTAVVTLLPGVPMRDSLNVNEYDYFKFSVDQSTEIQLVLTPLSGDPDMYVNCGIGPNATVLPNATNGAPWSSRLVGLDVITIHPNDPNACHGVPGSATNYYVGVTSFTRNASFSLLAYATSADPVLLVDGQPQTGEVDTGITQDYIFYAPPGWSAVQVRTGTGHRVAGVCVWPTTPSPSPPPPPHTPSPQYTWLAL